MSAPMMGGGGVGGGAGGGGNKKSGGGGSSNSSMANTPASTPITTMANGQQASPPPNNAPKYGTLVPNRIFVGGISANTTETELLQLFSNYGAVKAAKIIQDRAGVSKGYGFITFESEDDAKRLQRDQDNIVLRERKLNIAPAIKKQPFSRAFDGSSPPTVAPGFAPNFFPPASMPFFQGGLAYYPQPPTGPADPATQPPAVFQTPSVYPPQSAPPQAAPYQPVMFPPPPIYMPQQYPMPMPYDISYYGNGGGPYITNGGGGQNGGGAGGQVPPPPQQQQQQQRPASPPRGNPAAHCYAQQMQSSAVAAAAAAAAVGFPSQDMYYNMPLYQVEGAIYADPSGLDAMALGSGVVPEDYHSQQQPPPQDDYHTVAAKGTRVMMRQPPPASGGGAAPPQPAPPQPAPPPPSVDQQRQTATPVISLLSLDHQQEKDLLSMQSGRRRKPPPSTPPTTAGVGSAGGGGPPLITHQHHAYMPPQAQPLQPHHPHHHHVPRHVHPQHAPHTNGYATYGPVSVEYHYAHIVPFGSTLTTAPTMPPPAPVHTLTHASKTNGWSAGGKRPPWKSYDARRSVDTSSLSSPRTDSNSSASAVIDEGVHHGRHADERRRYSQPNMRGYSYGGRGAHSSTSPAPSTGYNAHPGSNNSHYGSGSSHFNSHYPNSSQYNSGSSHFSGPNHQQRRVFVPSGKNHYRGGHHNNNHRHINTPPPAAPSPAAITCTSTIAPPTAKSPVTVPLTTHTTSVVVSAGSGTLPPSTPTPPATTQQPPPSSGDLNEPPAFVPQMQPMPQHFVAPSRHRSRRTMRRGAGLGEIGAGDAPLTAVDGIQDACSKMDGLKL